MGGARARDEDDGRLSVLGMGFKTVGGGTRD